MQRKIIYLADDLTGACDTASYICDYTGEARVILNFDKDINSKSVKAEDNASLSNFVISTNTRNFNPEDTCLKLEKLGKFLKNTESKRIFKKIDSAFRGNVVLEINTLMNIFNKNICFVINSIPSMDRITLGGFQLIKGRLLDESEFMKDPVRASSNPFIPYLFTENKQGIDSRKACHIFLETVRYGNLLNAINDEISKGISIFSFDAITNGDIEKIIDIIYEKFDEALYAGTLGLLEALNKKIFMDSCPDKKGDKKCQDLGTNNLKEKNKDKETDFENKGSRFVGITASKYEITKKQINKLRKKQDLQIFKLKINDLIYKKDNKYISKIDKVSDDIIKNSDKKGLFIVTEFRGKKEPEKLSDMILKIISEVSKRILKSIEFFRLVLIGGETALNILDTFKVSNIRILGRIIDGISFGIISDGLLEGKEILIKGGSVGDTNSVINMVNFEF
ncbi:MAG: four-carbon acid sugar kinase family protein [Candidatus Humimicrobiaceae bacterium]